MHWKFYSLISVQKKLPFNVTGFMSPVNGLVTFYIGIETTECAKKQTMFQRKI